MNNMDEAIASIEQISQRVTVYSKDDRYFIMGALFEREITKIEYDQFNKLNHQTESRSFVSKNGAPDVSKRGL